MLAQAWDGVHLSIGGLLTTEEVGRGELGAWTHFTGWNAECTAWLRWVFSHVECLPDAG